MKFGERLDTLIGDRNKGDVAKGIRVSPGAITNYIKENRVPDAEILFRMAEFFGVSMEYLLTGTERAGHSGIELHDREIARRDWDTLCVEHLRQWLDRRAMEPELHAWALVELRQRFPLAAPGEPTRPGGKASSTRVSKERYSAETVAAMVPPRHDAPGRPPKLPVDESNERKP